MKKILFIFLATVLLTSLANAQINFGLGTDRIDRDLIVGEMRDIPAKISNDGICDIKCSYNSPGFNEPLNEMISPGQKFPFPAKFIVPECEKDNICRITIEIFCKEQGENCFQEYNQASEFEIMNVMHPGSEKNIGNEPLKAEEQEPTAAEKIGDIIGIILVIIIFIFILFGFLLLIIKIIKYLKNQWGSEKLDEKSSRKLSAIMFTDMKGYSKEMGLDEEATLKKVWRYEKAMKSIIKENDGRIVKTIGDAIMGDFNSAVNAVKAAISIQNLLNKEDIKIRIGIHLGDVIHKGGDIFGDGVNIASRIESICEPGKIYISEDVYNQVKGKIPANFENLGNRALKNIESPPKVFKIK